MTSVELREQRAALAADSKNWLNKAEADGLPEGEVSQEWAKRMGEIDRLAVEADRLERRERMENLEADLAKPLSRKTGPSVPGERAVKKLDKSERNRALATWLAYGSAAKVRSNAKVLEDLNSMGLQLNNPNAECRAVGTVSATGGAGQAALTSAAPGLYGSISPDLQIEFKYYSDVVNSVTRFPTGDGQDFVIPRVSDISRTVSIVAEGADAPEGPDPTFDRVTLKDYYFRQIVLATYEMLEDSRFDLESFLSQSLADGYGRTIEGYLVNGTGSGQPQGFVNGTAGSQVVTLPATKKTIESFDQLMQLVYTVDPIYRQNCTFVFNDSAVYDVRRIKNTQGAYIWDVNTAVNGPVDRVLGYPYLISNSMDATGSFSKNISWFGDLKKEVYREVDGVQIVRLNELHARRGMVGFYLLARSDARWTGFTKSSALLATPAA